MIWNAHADGVRQHAFGSEDLSTRIAVLCAEHGMDSSAIFETLEGVQSFCLSHHGTCALPDEYLSMLAARALSVVGERGCAEDLLSEMCAEHTVTVCRPLDHTGVTCANLWRRNKAGVVRDARWSSAPRESAWVLDMHAVEWEESEVLEIVFLPVVRRLIEDMAHVWDSSSGAGWLGVRGLRRGAERVAGRAAKDRRTRLLLDEFKTYCRGVLDAAAERRGWRRSPELVAVDL